MKRIVCIWVSAMMLALVLITLGAAQSQPLGDYARAARKDKKTGAAAKQFDNDNLPKSDKLSIVGQAPATETKDGDGNSDVASNVNPSTDSNSGTDKPKDSAAEAAQTPTERLVPHVQTTLLARVKRIGRDIGLPKEEADRLTFQSLRGMAASLATTGDAAAPGYASAAAGARPRT